MSNIKQCNLLNITHEVFFPKNIYLNIIKPLYSVPLREGRGVGKAVVGETNQRHYKKKKIRDFSGGSDGKVSAYNVGDLGLIPGLGRSSGEGNGNPLQYSCLGNPMDGGAW